MFMRGAAGLGSVVVFCCASGASPTPVPVLQASTVAVVPGTIAAFAQDGPRLAWIRPDAPCGGRVIVFDLRTRRRISLEQRRSRTCSESPETIAIGGSRALWEVVSGAGNTELDLRVVTAATDDRRNRSVGTVVVIGDEIADYYRPLVAGHGSTLVFYSVCQSNCSTWSGIDEIVHGSAHHLFAVASPLALAATGADVAALLDLYPCPCNYEPQWSPDGTRIAWGRLDGIYVMNADGGAKRRVSPAGCAEFAQSCRANATSPQWSPDGSTLAYSYSRRFGAPPEIHTVNADGSGDRRLTSGSEPRWSPSGGKLSFVRSGDAWTINADGSGAKRLTADGRGTRGGAEWSPDGSRLAEVRAAALYVIRADGTGQTRIAPAQQEYHDSTPRWSPRGDRIAFTDQGRIAVVNADGSGLQYVSTKGSAGSDPAWSPDGSRLAFDNPSNPEQAFVVSSAGGSATALTPTGLAGRDVLFGNPAWSPDGTTVALGDSELMAQTDRRNAGVYTVAADGTALKKLAPDDQTGVEVRDARTGARTASFVVRADAYVLTLSRSFLALLIQTPATDNDVLQVYRLGAAAPVGSISVPKHTADSTTAVSASGIAVFWTGKQIRAFDAQTGATRTIATERTTPIGLSIDGQRLAWAKRRGRRSVIEVVVLPMRL
jgi:Tol biopolymer transport system component